MRALQNLGSDYLLFKDRVSNCPEALFHAQLTFESNHRGPQLRIPASCGHRKICEQFADAESSGSKRYADCHRGTAAGGSFWRPRSVCGHLGLYRSATLSAVAQYKWRHDGRRGGTPGATRCLGRSTKMGETRNSSRSALSAARPD